MAKVESLLKQDTIVIERRFCGPPESGNGGYVCGRLAQFLKSDSVAVRLHAPPPLEKNLEVRSSENSASLFDRDIHLAEARVASVGTTPIDSPGYEKAEAAAHKYRGFRSHWFPSCFVCGPNRKPQDGLRIFPGPIEGEAAIAAPWIPDPSLGTDNGLVRPEFLWAALDCPGAFTFAEPNNCIVLLGELQVTLIGDVAVNERCVIVAWEVSQEGRKHRTATALFGDSGSCRAVGLGTWIEVSPNVLKGANG